MYDIRKEQLKKERAYLLGVGLANQTAAQVEEHLDELALLAETAGAVVVGRAYQMRPSPDSKFFIGSGRADEAKKEIVALSADLIVFDDDLSPSQIKNLEKLFEKRTLDRSMLILDIFSKHARTHESKIQVELAQMRYMAPRLTGLWTHLGQQTGGIGTRGPGETQLEVDKRVMKKRIAELEKKLDAVQRQRDQQNKRRERVFKAAIVGYTNVGKSTLLNALSKSKVLTADKLFATLDATTRRVYLPGFGEALLSDTVGFIRKLPHHLVASFRSTLGVITEADCIVLLMDAATAQQADQMEIVNRVLNELETERLPRLLVFNKIDCADAGGLEGLRTANPDALFVSALSGQGLEEFKAALRECAIRSGCAVSAHEKWAVMAQEKSAEGGGHAS
ncbi:MAG: GTPase HflX [Fibrobacterota bacterium]